MKNIVSLLMQDGRRAWKYVPVSIPVHGTISAGNLSLSYYRIEHVHVMQESNIRVMCASGVGDIPPGWMSLSKALPEEAAAIDMANRAHMAESKRKDDVRKEWVRLVTT
jgi:hypothetical protein